MTACISPSQTSNSNTPQNANRVYVSYGSRRYAVKILQMNGANSQEITGLRDWTNVTRIALDYLREEMNSPFDFNRMKKTHITFRGDVALNNTTRFANPNPAVITSIRWSQTSTQPLEEIPLPASRQEGLDKLRRLGVELATYRPLNSTPQVPPPPVPVPPIPPPTPRPSSPPSQPRPASPDPLPPGETFIHDAGGGGDCGPNSIAHQLSLMPGRDPKTPQQLRNEVFSNFDRMVHDERLRGYVLQSLQEERDENLGLNSPSLANAITISGQQAETDLHLFNHAVELNLSEQERNNCLARLLTYRKERLHVAGTWVDKDFLYILGKLNTPIGIIRKEGNQYIIEERFPSDRPIDRDRTAWIYYNGNRTNGGCHFQSFHRNRPDFDRWIEQLLLENRNQAIAHLCDQLQLRRPLFNFGDLGQQTNALAAIKRNIIDLRNQHPDVFTRMVDLMRQHNPALPFDATTFAADNNAHYEAFLDNQYLNILTAQNLMNT